MNRRRFLNQTLKVTGLALMGQYILKGVSWAQEMVKESDTQAKAFNYVKAPTSAEDRKGSKDNFDTKPAEQFCNNCNLYTKTSEEAGECALFPGKLVHTKGWCKQWVPKS